MKHFAAMVATLALSAASPAQAQTKAVPSASPALAMTGQVLLSAFGTKRADRTYDASGSGIPD